MMQFYFWKTVFTHRLKSLTHIILTSNITEKSLTIGLKKEVSIFGVYFDSMYVGTNFSFFGYCIKTATKYKHQFGKCLRYDTKY